MEEEDGVKWKGQVHVQAQENETIMKSIAEMRLYRKASLGRKEINKYGMMMDKGNLIFSLL